jgi:hypothetical protein
MTIYRIGDIILRLLCLISVAGACLMQVSGAYANDHNGASMVATPSASTTIQGTWSGTFTSNSPNTSPFTITVVINSDSHGRFVGDASLVFDCIKSHRLQVTVNGSVVVLAGSDADGDNITFRGTMDSTGTLLNLNYVLNGSAGRRCETDNGSGTLLKR